MYIVSYNLKRLVKWVFYTTNRKWRDRRNGKNVVKINTWILCVAVIYGGWGYGILSPNEDGSLLFRASGGSIFSYGQWGDSFIWGSQLGICLGGLQYKFLAQLANTGPKSVKVNITNCHGEICKTEFYQIVTSDVLTSLWQFDKMLF